MAAPAINGATPDANGPMSKPTNAQYQSRASLATKMNDAPRKPDDEPSQRRAPQHKAWTGVNPITQRSNTPTQANGAGVKPSPKNTAAISSNLEKPGSDRQAWTFNDSVGRLCHITTKSGEAFAGVLAGSEKIGDDYKLLFKMVRKVDSAGNDQEYCGVGDDHAMIFHASNLVLINVPELPAKVNTQNGAAPGFRTDVDISGNQAIRERDLQRWEAPSGSAVDMSLETAGDWDQFKANEQKFGVRTDYDETLYTTQIDRSHPLHKMRERDAERIAREIESDQATNAHVREERGYREDDGADEEEKYSGVRRNVQEYPPLQSNQPNRYMPPARRAQQNAATSSTAAGNGQIDPAIISSQIARPETASESKSEKSENPGSKPQPAPVAPPTSATTVSPSTSATAKEVKPVRHAGKAGQTATENVETEVLDSFRQFVNTEKMKVQDQKRSRASADKAVKLNDLMKFSKNFKLLTPVPKDLIPILAKDENKQREIVQKAQRNADTSKPLKPTTIAEQKSQRPLTMARWEGDSAPPTGHQASVSRNQANAGLPKDRQQQTRELAQSARNQNGLSARLTDSHRLHKANMPVSIPNPLPIQAGGSMRGGSNFNKGMPSPQKTPGGRGPPSATSTKFNVQAMEFKPNPTASAFKPGGPVANTVASNTMTTNSPKSTPATRPISPLNPPAKFFSEKPNFGKLETRASPLNGVRPTAPTAPQIQTWAEATVNGGSKVDPTALPASNGYVQYPYRTHPTWVLAEANETEVRYYEAYGSRNLRQTTPPHQASPVNLTAHQHQLPLHLQNGAPNAQLPQVQTPQQIPHQMHPQPHHFPHAPHYDDNHMRPSASTSSVYPAPSPRMQNTNMAYHQSPMPRHASLAYNQPPVQYVMHPGPQMAGRQFSNGGPNMMPGQGAHLAPMMVQAPSAGGFVAQPMAIPYAPQMQMYPGPNMPMYGTPSQPPSNYPSPGQGAPMMVHQGSHQGHQQVMFPAGQFAQPVFQGQPPAHMTQVRGGYGSPQPHFAQNVYPHGQPQHHYPHQQQRTPSTGYVQPHQVHHQHMASQPPPQPAGPPEAVDEAK